MKYIFSIFFLSFISVFSFAQNGALSNENNVLKLEYKGYYENYHLFIVNNKLNCQQKVIFDNKIGNSTIRLINSFDTIQYKAITSEVDFTVKVKKESGGECEPQPDNGWVEQRVLLSKLSTRISSFNAYRGGKNIVNIDFLPESENNVKHYLIMVSKDGKNFTPKDTILPNNYRISNNYFKTLKF